ncbi:hypothetical protein IW138_004416 [Coemansia sp. RSA 986]|nr:hypothetical protein IW138_004416 [Coemansia sp. RSA 986]
MSNQQPPYEEPVNSYHENTNADFVTTVNAKLDIIKEQKKEFELLQQAQIEADRMDIQEIHEAEVAAQEEIKKVRKELAAKKELISNRIEARAAKTADLKAELKTEQDKLVALVDKHLPDLTDHIKAAQLAPVVGCSAYTATAIEELPLGEVSGKHKEQKPNPDSAMEANYNQSSITFDKEGWVVLKTPTPCYTAPSFEHQSRPSIPEAVLRWKNEVRISESIKAREYYSSLINEYDVGTHAGPSSRSTVPWKYGTKK